MPVLFNEKNAVTFSILWNLAWIIPYLFLSEKHSWVAMKTNHIHQKNWKLWLYQCQDAVAICEQDTSQSGSWSNRVLDPFIVWILVLTCLTNDKMKGDQIMFP